jgi:hypothetical protein
MQGVHDRDQYRIMNMEDRSAARKEITPSMFSCQCDRCAAVISDILYRIMPKAHRFQVVSDDPYVHPIDEATQTKDLCAVCYREFLKFCAPTTRTDAGV